MKILISSPSLDSSTHVSGISALVKPLVETFPCFSHLHVGTSDADNNFILKIESLLKAIVTLTQYRLKHADFIFHVNTAANTLSLLRDSILLIVAKLLKIKCVIHFHGGYWLTSHKSPIFIKLLVQFLCYYSDSCIVLGPEESAILNDKFGIKRKFISLPNFAGSEFFKNPNNIEKKEFSMIFLGRLVESKSADKLPEILKEILLHQPYAHLSICGDGPLKEQLLSNLKQIPEKYWRYHGVVFGNRKRDLLLQSDVLILPSVNGEGMPIAMLEAMATGCIPIVTKLGAIPSVIRNSENGFITPPGDIDLFIRTTIEVLGNPNKGEIRTRCHSVASTYSIEIYKKRLDIIYLSI